MRAIVLAVLAMMARAAIGQHAEGTWVKTSPIFLQRARADTVEVPLNVLQGLAVSEQPIAAPQDAPQVGVIALKLLVSSTGDVEETAANAKGNVSLRQAAQDGAMRWKYRPYLLNGKPREFEATILIRFTAGIGTRIAAPPQGGLAHPPMGGKASLGDTGEGQVQRPPRASFCRSGRGPAVA